MSRVCAGDPRRTSSDDAGKKIDGRTRHVAAATCGLLAVVVVTASLPEWADAGHPGRPVRDACRIWAR